MAHVSSPSQSTFPYTKDFPSGDHVGAPWLSSLCDASFGFPPATGAMKILQGRFGCLPMKAIDFPSGDHLGNCTDIPAESNCLRPAPSNRLTHKVLSCEFTYATSCRSFATST